MSQRVNIMLSDSIWGLLRSVPKGERSAFVEQALSEAFSLQDRRAAVAEMERLRETMTPAEGCSEDWIREQRDRP